LDRATTAVPGAIPVILMSPEVGAAAIVHALAPAQACLERSEEVTTPPQRGQTALSGAEGEAVTGCWLLGIQATFIQATLLLEPAHLTLFTAVYQC
jgi:hypothetical protein